MTTAIVDKEKFYTLEEFAALPDDGKRYELWEGKLVEMTAAREDHSRIGTRLLTYLGYFITVLNNRCLVLITLTIKSQSPLTNLALVGLTTNARTDCGVTASISAGSIPYLSLVIAALPPLQLEKSVYNQIIQLKTS